MMAKKKTLEEWKRDCLKARRKYYKVKEKADSLKRRLRHREKMDERVSTVRAQYIEDNRFLEVENSRLMTALKNAEINLRRISRDATWNDVDRVLMRVTKALNEHG